MSDRQIPMAPAELLTVCPPEAKPQDSYGTAVLQKVKKHHTGLIVIFCVLCVLLATGLALFGLAQLRFDFSKGKFSLRPAPTAPSEPAPQEKELQPNANAAPDRQAPDLSGESLDLGTKTPPPAEGLSVQEIYEKTAPGVVCVIAEGYGGQVIGTGIILDENGFILTTEDAIDGLQIRLITNDGTQAAAQLVGIDADTGFALLRSELTNCTPVCFGDTQTLQVGDRLYCIGNPYGESIRNVLSEGILSGCSSCGFCGQTVTVIDTTAAFGAGNNGCPVIDGTGAVIGVTCAVGAGLTGTGGDPGFALGAADVQRIAQEIMTAAETAADCWLGFEVEQIPDTYRYYYGFPGMLWISRVGTDTYADGALSVYDVIVSVDGTEIGTVEEYQAVLADRKPGETVELRIYRGGFFYRIDLPLTKR